MVVSIENPLRIGTRGSPLALAQAEETRDRLVAACNLPIGAFTIEVIQTSGDRIQDRPLREVGGKGLFTKEIEEALLDGRIDIAVHSMKDMPVAQPDGLGILCVLPREDVRDGFVSLNYNGLAEMPAGARLGTSSLRRRSQVQYRRPELDVVEFRGNVQTRLRKLEEGVAHATFLAMAGLNRLGMSHLATPIETDDILPAVAQGAIGIEARLDDFYVASLLEQIGDRDTWMQLLAERSFLKGLDGSCQTPIAGHATLEGTQIHLRGEILSLDGKNCVADHITGQQKDAVQLGAELADKLLVMSGGNYF